MIMVFLAHAYFDSFSSMHGTFIGRVIDRMDVAFAMFFMLSAFLLFRPFALAHLSDRPRPSSRRFLRHRFFRIAPAYWICLIVLSLFGIIHFTSVGQALSFFGLYQIYSSNRVLSVGIQPIYQSWSLATELSFYLMLPIWAWLIHRVTRGATYARRIAAQFVGVGVLYGIAVVFRIYVLAADPSWERQAALWLPAYLDIFAIGMGLAVISAHSQIRGTVPRPIAWLAERPWFCWSVALVLFAMVVTYRPLRQPLTFTGTEYMSRQFFYGAINFFWLLPAMFGDQTQGLIRRIMSHRATAFIGAISLSFYLYHGAVLHKLQEWTGATAFQANFGELVAIGVPVSILIAIPGYLLIEQGFLKLKDRPLRSYFTRAGTPSTP
jgi:peptidoglycan/LPS O-acetylase OafA/YrhL